MNQINSLSGATMPQSAYHYVRVCSFIGLIFIISFALLIVIFQPGLFSAGTMNFNIMALFLFLKQDVLVFPVFLVGLLFTPYAKKAAVFSIKYQAWLLCLCLATIFVVCWLGHYIVFLNYDLSRDEQMANFDADIFSHLKLFAPIPTQWRPMANALNQTYILPIGDHEGWVSFYLPINAVFRAMVGAVVSRTMASPMMVVIGAVALWRLVSQLLPDSRQCQWVALALYAGSSQVIITGMTAYAMTAHLALNLVWLTLFLERKSAADAAAIFVGWLATGLHQPLFHPLFILPFLALLAAENDRRRLMIFGGSYALIILFWLAWPSWISSFGHEAVPQSDNPNGISVFGRLSHLIAIPGERSIWLMSVNLLRFVFWQHLLLLPLCLFGLRANWTAEPFVRALACGILLTILAMFILEPYQGHGWGYRYLHGLIGSACLLAAYGYRSFERQGYSFANPMIFGTFMSAFILLPTHAILARQLVSPFVTASHLISRENAGIVVVNDEYAPFAQDLVLNRPDLSNAPLRLLGSNLTSRDMVELCRRYSVDFFDHQNMQAIATLFAQPSKGGITDDRGSGRLKDLKLACGRS